MKTSTWASSRKPDELLNLLDQANLDKARPIRLLACAFGRLIWHLLKDDVGRSSVELVEQFIDGRASWTDLRVESVRLAAIPTPERDRDRAIHEIAVEILMPLEISARRANGVARATAAASKLIDRESIVADQCELIREIFGPVDDPPRFDPAWLTPTVMDVARGIHHDRGFDRMPILGDALEEAGCWDASILDHCRAPADHVRGCWVVDRLIARR